MRMHTPPECQGQTVEVSYGWGADGRLYRLSCDRSDGTETWAVADRSQSDRLSDGWSPANTAPPLVTRWRRCGRPE